MCLLHPSHLHFALLGPPDQVATSHIPFFLRVSSVSTPFCTHCPRSLSNAVINTVTKSKLIGNGLFQLTGGLKSNLNGTHGMSLWQETGGVLLTGLPSACSYIIQTIYADMVPPLSELGHPVLIPNLENAPQMCPQASLMDIFLS